MRAYRREWRQRDPERQRARERAKRTRGKDRIRAYNASRWINDPEGMRAYHAAWRAANRERVAQTCKKWRLSNPDAVAAFEGERRRRKLDAEGTFTRADVGAQYRAQNGLCYYCKTPLRRRFHVDHKTPLSRGGTNWPDNLCCACASCNHRKNTKTAEEFFRILAQGNV